MFKLQVNLIKDGMNHRMFDKRRNLVLITPAVTILFDDSFSLLPEVIPFYRFLLANNLGPSHFFVLVLICFNDLVSVKLEVKLGGVGCHRGYILIRQAGFSSLHTTNSSRKWQDFRELKGFRNLINFVEIEIVMVGYTHPQNLIV